jgi:hypothetical protein
MRLNEVYKNSGLGKWFHGESANKTPGWDRYDSKGNLAGECGDAKEGEAYSACLSKQKAAKLGKEGRAKFVKRKRSAQSKAGRGKKGSGEKGKKPINVKTGAAKMDECYECQDNLILEGKNKPNDPDKWSACKSAAKSKFDVYPSAYANAWAAKCYKKKGGTWRSVNEETEISDVKKAVKENIIFNFMENAKPEFARRGGNTRQRPKSWSKGTKSGSEKKKSRREGIKQSDPREVYEGVSVYNPTQQVQEPQQKETLKSKTPPKDSTQEKLSGVPETPSIHSTQLRVLRSLVPAYSHPNVEPPQMGAPDPLNTVNTPRYNTGIKSDVSGIAGKRISSMQSQIADLESDLKMNKFELKVTREKLSDIQTKAAERRMRRAVNRAAKRMDSTSPSDVLDMMKRKDTGPGLFDAV